MLFLSKLTSGVATTVHYMFLEHFGDIIDTINPPLLANFGGAINAQLINALSHTSTHSRWIEKRSLLCFTPYS